MTALMIWEWGMVEENEASCKLSQNIESGLYDPCPGPRDRHTMGYLMYLNRLLQYLTESLNAPEGPPPSNFLA